MGSILSSLLPWDSKGRKKRVFAQINLGSVDGLFLHQWLADLILLWDSTSPMKGAQHYLLQSDSSTLCNSFYFLHFIE